VGSVYDLTYRDALIIGSFQVLSLIPGTSRSGSTILGGMLFGSSRTAASEFSFFMAIPVMLGASLLKVLKLLAGGFSPSSTELAILAVGIVTSFAVSMIAIKFLMEFVKRHSFAPFGVYRIILGALVVLFFALR
jgi:undecaprenyl-diphosphatase